MKKIFWCLIVFNLLFLNVISCVPRPKAPDGAALYTNNCAGCHGPADATTKAGADIARINAGIANEPTMSSLSTLSAAEVKALADFLATATPPPPPAAPNGLSLYNTNCAGCHGTAEATEKAGADVTRITNSIANEPTMSSLSTLTSAEIQALADFLATASPPPPAAADGLALYNTNCAGCHGTADATEKAGADVTRITNSIANEPSMSSLSTLSTAEIQALADFLANATPPPPPPPAAADGAQLYATHCASCHGPGDNSAKANADVTRINAGIETEPTMQSLSSVLSAADIDAIAQFLTAQGPTEPTDGCRYNPPSDHTDKEDGCYHKPGKRRPFKNGCANCHGKDLRGDVAPSCYTCHGRKWKSRRWHHLAWGSHDNDEDHDDHDDDD